MYDVRCPSASAAGLGFPEVYVVARRGFPIAVRPAVRRRMRVDRDLVSCSRCARRSEEDVSDRSRRAT